jgi:hypothetical protein
VNKFSLQSDSIIEEHPEAISIGSISAEETKTDPMDLILEKMRKSAHKIMKQAAARLLDHKSSDYAIDIKEAETAP